MSCEHRLSGRRVLVVEDEYLIMEEMVALLRDHGARVIGPAANLSQALHIVEAEADIDGAVLDVNVQGEMVFPVADALETRGVPFVFATGYDRSVVPARHANVQLCEKPVDVKLLARALFCGKA